MAHFSTRVLQKAIASEPPILVHGDLDEPGTLTSWEMPSSSGEEKYMIVTDGDTILSCSCRRGQTRQEFEMSDCYHSASVSLALLLGSEK